MFTDVEVGADEPEFCPDCGEELHGENRSEVYDTWGNEVCVGCTTECPGCSEQVRIEEMRKLWDYDGRDYCGDCNDRYLECESDAKDRLLSELTELTHQMFEEGCN